MIGTDSVTQEQDLQDPERWSFLISLLAKRKDAITARQASGIEQEWQEDDEHYNGIDDANRQYPCPAYSGIVNQQQTSGNTDRQGRVQGTQGDVK